MALAAAKATAIGDWTGVPMVGTARPSKAPRTPLGTVQDGITVADPAATGTGSYVFSAMIRHDAGARAYLVRITVERTPRGYAIRLTG
ncbi:hypothetical protein LUW76_33820 [Actinomadura madurae]|uniref:hypothetical protein n=1 Tax=Actinomadura madurae TaxID=1993 RepID=UPI002025DE8B|nr:hypothetical protein [Actinomadura madurae]URM98913.1 hypothetical protein LUW76_33820 [Actinomadura madurae]